MLDGKEGRRGPRGDSKLVVDVLDTVVDGLLGDRERPADLLLGVSACNQMSTPGKEFS